MKVLKHGTSKEESRRHEKCGTENISETMGFSETNCRSNGDEPHRVDRQDSGGENLSLSQAESIGDDGKILDWLKLLQTEYLTYLSDHRERLKARLDENIAKEQSFKQSINELEREIQELIIESRNNLNKPS